MPNQEEGPSWSWSYGSWIYNYLCNQCLSLLMLWVWIPPKRGVLDTTCCKVCHWLASGQWFSMGTPVSSTNKTDRHDITEILLKVVLNTMIKNSKKGVACYAYNVSVYYTLTFTVDKPTRYNWNIVESGVNTITITLDKLCFVSFYRTWHHG
jgi:hypothetical protein